ncbi:high mobility group B protein 14 [Musa acuminata AAA Group]|uniref:high mobility group B protein 14 n=1 Tax=Musa acuminata AAA Group TaxID=214697 RepID=UPI0031DC7324
MKTRAKSAEATATAMKPKVAPTKKKSRKKPSASSSAKDDHRDKPKKPPTAFFYYLEDFRKTYQQENPNVKSMRDIGKACGEKWKTMSFEEKVAYYDIATEKRAEFEKAMAAYIKRKESGEMSEESDDYE